MQLQKARIAEVGPNNEDVEPFDVQFNPTTLRLTLDNRVVASPTELKAPRQVVGRNATTLALDLIFDSADEGTTADPSSVRLKTKKVEKFLLPKSDVHLEPPIIRFSWGDLIMDGTLDNLTVDFDHFAADGAPLRAKMSLSIKGQDRDQILKSIKPDPARKGAPKPGGSGSGGLGISAGLSLGVSVNTTVALAGESAGELAARIGIDPAAWRGLDLGGESSLALSAGAEIGFSAGLNASTGLGVTLGVEAGAAVSLEASFGLEASAGMNAVAGVGVGSDLASGFALSSAGGVTNAIASVQTAKSQAAEQQARAAFKAPAKSLPAATLPTTQAISANATGAPAASAQPKQPEQKHVPLSNTGLPSVSSQQTAQPAPRIPRADPRASGFGFGVPLRNTVGEAADRRAESIRGDVAIKPKVSSGDPPSTTDPTTPAWVALPKRDRGRGAVGKLSSSLRPKRPCGCGGGCKH